MRTILVGSCSPDRMYQMADPDAPTEAEFELAVAKILSCVYAKYQCFVFGGTFRHEQRGYRPDLALVARDFSHWFIIEVELVSHSFEGHVLPQVRAFRYGEPQPDCVAILARELVIPPAQAETLLLHVPKSVAVVGNRKDREWEVALAAHEIQMLSVSVFRTPAGGEAVEVEGRLEVMSENLGFGIYSATDRSLRFAKGTRLQPGEVQLYDLSGAPGLWDVALARESVWVTKTLGAPDIPDGSYVRLVRSFDGKLSLR